MIVPANPPSRQTRLTGTSADDLQSPGCLGHLDQFTREIKSGLGVNVLRLRDDQPPTVALYPSEQLLGGFFKAPPLRRRSVSSSTFSSHD